MNEFKDTAKKTSRATKHEDIVHLGRGRRPYRVERGEHGEFKRVKGPVKEGSDWN